jgi:hypothetical protein
MIQVSEIMKQIEHMETNTPEQMQERETEAFRLIKEKEDETMLKHKIVMLKHEVYMLKMEEKLLLSREKHELYLTKLRIQIQEARSHRPKRQIYFGKVKTE